MATLAVGSKGDEVRRLQALLSLAGFDARPIDGDFGGGTARAVRDYQGANGLDATGKADDETQASVGMNQPDATEIQVPVIDRVTTDIVRGMFSPATPQHNVELHLPIVLAGLRDADLDDRDIVLLALATIRAETEGFEPIDEQVSTHNTDPGAHGFNRYDHRASLGNQGPPDGERFKGRGFIQLTGRANYQKISEKVGLGNELVEQPERANEADVAARILAAFILEKRSAAKYAVLGNDLETARKLVNGGSHGLDRFARAFEIGAQRLG